MRPFGLLLRIVALSLALTCPTAALAADDAIGPEAPAAGSLTTIFRFLGSYYWPRGGVALDAAGNIYGTTLYGGNCTTCGVVYKLTRPAPGQTKWTVSVLHAFVLGPDGIAPTAPLTIKGNTIYGTTSAGANPSCGCGEVFSLTPAGTKWTYTVLHRFNNILGTQPIGGLLIDTDGTIYGTTAGGGAHQSGVLYKITPAGAFSVLHTFDGKQGGGPQGELMFGKDGAIYGTTFGGGKYNQGVVFRITKAGSYKVLHAFLGVDQPGGSHDGANPEGRLAQAANGTIYGTTTFGGNPSGYGTAWSLTPPKPGGTTWTYQQIYIFGNNTVLPNLPHSGLVIDPAGNLLGTGAGGGTFGSGTLYRLSPPKTGTTWTMTVLHSFKAIDPGGDSPNPDIVLRNGVIYGSTLTGGTNTITCSNSCGTVFTYHSP